VTNADEAARGTDPRKPDTDGDGKGDRIDACPTTAGLGDTGCPRFDDRTPPLLTISGVRRTLRYTSFLRGVKASATTNEPATLKFELFAAARSGTISKSAFNLRLRRVALRLATGTRSVRLRFARGVLGDARRFVVLLRVTATDASGNRIAASRRIRVR